MRGTDIDWLHHRYSHVRASLRASLAPAHDVCCSVLSALACGHCGSRFGPIQNRRDLTHTIPSVHGSEASGVKADNLLPSVSFLVPSRSSGAR